MIALCLLFSLAASAGDRLLLITHLMLSVTISGSEVSLVSFVVRPDHFVPDGLGCDFLPFIGNVFAMDAGFLKLDDRFHEGCHRVEFIVRLSSQMSGGRAYNHHTQDCLVLRSRRRRQCPQRWPNKLVRQTRRVPGVKLHGAPQRDRESPASLSVATIVDPFRGPPRSP
jgi:hypothetical protein